MGFDLPRAVTSVLFTFLIFTLLSVSFVSMGTESGVAIDNKTYEHTFNNTLTIAKNMEDNVREKGAGTDSQNAFFPSLPTIFELWDLSKAALKDMTQAIDDFFGIVGGGKYVVIAVAIIVTSISLIVLWIIISWLFKTGGTRTI